MRMVLHVLTSSEGEGESKAPESEPTEAQVASSILILGWQYTLCHVDPPPAPPQSSFFSRPNRFIFNEPPCEGFSQIEQVTRYELVTTSEPVTTYEPVTPYESSTSGPYDGALEFSIPFNGKFQKFL